jgi:hypothetical protein
MTMGEAMEKHKSVSSCSRQIQIILAISFLLCCIKQPATFVQKESQYRVLMLAVMALMYVSK